MAVATTATNGTHINNIIKSLYVSCELSTEIATVETVLVAIVHCTNFESFANMQIANE